MRAPDPVPLLQMVDRPGILDLSWGHPSLDLLPVAGVRAAAADALAAHGSDALGYGRDAGPIPFIEWLCTRLTTIDARAPLADEVVVTAGASQALDLVTTVLARRGDVVLVESPTYHLAVGILRDHPVDLVPIAFDGSGLRVDAVADAVDRLRHEGRTIRLLYTVPTYHNPTGVTLAAERRRELVELAATEGFTIVEDDVYRELAYDAPAPPSLWSIARPGTVVRLGSFSKSLAPGIRLGYATADASTAGRIAGSGLLQSGGGVAHFQALLVATYGSSGAFAAHVESLRSAYRGRRDALLAALEVELPAGASWTVPGGGYFTWVTLPDGLDAATLLAGAEGHGTAYVPGRVFHVGDGGGRSALRLAFSRYGPDELREAARRLGAAVRDARLDRPRRHAGS